MAEKPIDQPLCPGQDLRNWKPEDICYVNCPYCETEIEFWKDEPTRVCSGCKNEIPNPRLDRGCAKWCHSAEECRVGSGGRSRAARKWEGQSFTVANTVPIKQDESDEC